METLLAIVGVLWIIGFFAGSFLYCLIDSEVFDMKPTKEEFKAYVKSCLFFIFCIALFCPITYPVLGIRRAVRWYRSLD